MRLWKERFGDRRRLEVIKLTISAIDWLIDCRQLNAVLSARVIFTHWNVNGIYSISLVNHIHASILKFIQNAEMVRPMWTAINACHVIRGNGFWWKWYFIFWWALWKEEHTCRLNFLALLYSYNDLYNTYMKFTSYSDNNSSTWFSYLQLYWISWLEKMPHSQN